MSKPAPSAASVYPRVCGGTTPACPRAVNAPPSPSSPQTAAWPGRAPALAPLAADSPPNCSHLKSVTHPKIGRVSYTSAGNRAWGASFLFNSVSLYKTYTKPVRLRQTTTREQPHFRADFAARISARDASIFADFLMKSVAFPLVHFFVTFFALFCPFSLWSGAPKQKCNTSRPPFAPPFRAPRRSAERPSLSHRKDELASPAEAVQNRRSPRLPASPRKPTCAYERIPNMTNFHMIQPTTIRRPARNPAITGPGLFALCADESTCARRSAG